MQKMKLTWLLCFFPILLLSVSAQSINSHFKVVDEKTADGGLIAEGFPGYSKKKSEIIYVVDDSDGEASPKNYEAHFVDPKLSKELRKVKLKIPENPMEKIKFSEAIEGLNASLQKENFEQMKLVLGKGDAFPESDKKIQASSQESGMLYEYQSKTGTLIVHDRKTKKEVRRKILSKLQWTCYGNKKANKYFPNSIRVWSDPSRDAFLVETAMAVGDACNTPKNVELM
jgi:hypothetical protein